VIDGRRSTGEIRRSLATTRRRLDEDLEEIELRVEDGLSPRNLAMRHPVLVTIAGVLLGVVVVRNPALVARSVSRLVGLTAPWLVKGLLRRGSSRAAPDRD
jgi:hypothetical protein